MRRNLSAYIISILLPLALLLPLSALAQTTNSRTQSGTGTPITATGSSLNTNITNASLAVTGTFFQGTQPVSGTVAVSNSFLLDATFTGRFPAAAAEADTIANPTLTQISTFLHGYNGTTWDRLRSTIANGLAVDVTRVQGTVTVSGTVTANAGTNLNTSALALDATLTGRFPAAAVLADATANPTLTEIAVFLHGYNGTTWDRLKSTTANGLVVDVSRVQGNVTVGNSFLLDATYTGRMPAGASPATGESNTNTALSRIGTYPFVFNGTTWDRWTGAVSGTVAVSSAFLLDATYTGRMPAGASPGDGETNTNTALSRIGSYLFGYNGTTWDRLQVDASKFLKVNVQACTGCGLSVTDAAAFTSGASAFTPSGGEYNPTATALTSGQQGTQALTAYRSAYSTLSGSNAIETGTVLNPFNVQVAGVTGFFGGSTLQDPIQTQIATLDPFGRLQSVSTISDGSGRYAAMRGAEGAQLNDAGIVTSPSIAPSLQCPYVQAFSQTASATVVTNPGGKALHICWFGVVSTTAQSFSLVEGTGTVCATGIKALYGSTGGSAAFSANGGVHAISDRITLPMQVTGDNLCVIQSSSGNMSGTIVYGIY